MLARSLTVPHGKAPPCPVVEVGFFINWNLVDNILPQIHDDIMNHDGCMLIRGDSGDPVEVVTKTVFKLWEQFGGTVNKKGYKVLDPHIKAIYGDSITVQRCEKIFQILKENGFACNNV